jgi:hypothetical protein
MGRILLAESIREGFTPAKRPTADRLCWSGPGRGVRRISAIRYHKEIFFSGRQSTL